MVSPANRDSSADSDGQVARLVRIDAIVTSAREGLRAGRVPDIDALVDAHPELASDLRAALGGLAALDRASPGAESSATPPTIGPYQVIRELGRGGMGIVYEGYDESLERRVAIKVLPETVSARAGYVERFQREAHAAARLEHPNVVAVYGVGESAGRQFIAMKFVDGQGLDELMGELQRARDDSSSGELGPAAGHPTGALVRSFLTGRLGASQGDDDTGSGTAEVVRTAPGSRRTSFGRAYDRNVARIGLACARALDHAHRRGVLHRDIKPGNLLVDSSGHTWITDFGLAKLQELDDLTVEGDFVGTLRYTAPEQFQGQAEARSDVYGLGLVLYELLSLQRAFGTESRAELVHQVLHTMPKSPDRIRSEVPQDLARIVMKAIAKLPEERYRTAGDMAADLRAFLDGRPIAAHAPGALYLSRLAVNRNRPFFGAIAGLVVLLLIGAAAYVMQLRRSAELEESLAHRANLAAASALIRTADGPAALRRLLDCPVNLRAWEWHHLESSVDQSLRTIATFSEPVGRVRYAGDVLEIVHREGVELHGADGVRSVVLPKAPGDAAEVVDAAVLGGDWVVVHFRSGIWRIPMQAPFEGAFPPSGVTDFDRLPWSDSTTLVELRSGLPRAVVADRNGRLMVLDLEGMTERGSVLHGQRSVRGIDADADLKRVVMVGMDGRVVEWDTTKLTSRDLYATSLGLQAVALSPDGQRVAVGGLDRTVYVLRRDDGSVEQQLAGHQGPVTALGFSPDGALIASASDDRLVRLWDVESGTRLQTLRGHSSPVRTLVFRPDGQRLVTGSVGGVVKEWVIGVTGGRDEVYGHVADVVAASFSRSGEQFATGARDATIRIHDAATLRLDQLLLGHHGELNGVAWHADDRRLCSADRAGLLIDWDLATGEPAWQRHVGGTLSEPVVSADGASVYVGSRAGRIERIDAETGGRLASRDLDGESVHRLALDPGGARLLVGTESGALIGLGARDLEEIARAKRHDGAITAVVFSPTGDLLATSSRDRSVAFSAGRKLGADRRTLLGGGQNSWYADALDDACFSPDGRLLAVGSHNWLVHLVDVASGEPVLDLIGHEDWVRRVAFSPDGRSLVSTGSHSSVRVWDDRTTEEREAARASRVALEEAGRALVLSWQGSHELGLDEVEVGLSRLGKQSGGNGDLTRAARAVLHQERARRILDVLERRVATAWDAEDTEVARAYLFAVERTRPFGAREFRLMALIHVVRGERATAVAAATGCRALLGERAERSPLLLAIDAWAAASEGDTATAEACRAASLAVTGADEAERDAASAVLARLRAPR